MRYLAVHAAMKKKPARKNVSFRIAMNGASGTRKISGPNYGACTTCAFIRANMCAYFRSRTGPSSISGNTSRMKTWPCRRFIFRMPVKSLSAKACWFLSLN